MGQFSREEVINHLRQQFNKHMDLAHMYGQLLDEVTTNREKHMNKLLENQELTVRTTNALKADGYIFVGDVIVRSATQLGRIPNLGNKSVTELKELARGLGLVLGSPDEPWVRPEHPIQPVVRDR